MTTAQEAGQSAAAKQQNIGAMMPKSEWAQARDAVSDQGKTNGRVYLPKVENEYQGKIVFLTDTHLVQQVGKNSAVTHDLSKLENGADLAQQYDEKKIGPKTHIVVRYGAERGEGEVVPFTVQRANEVKKQGTEWAEKNITNERSRSTFVKHLEAFTADMAKGITFHQAKPAERAPERPRELERSR